jgi:hypothetical protein
MAVAESEPAVENGEDPILGGAECEERKREKREAYMSIPILFKLVQTANTTKNIRHLQKH